MLNYYRREDVVKEIVDYSKSRWVSIECESQEDRRIFLRYWAKGRLPLRIKSKEDVAKILGRFKSLKPRSIYATIHLYKSLSNVDDPSSIASTTPIWDIDVAIDDWKLALKAAAVIAEILEEEGVAESVYLKWSGRGIHVHLHENAFSGDLRAKVNPLDLAYATVEYVRVKAEKRLSTTLPRPGSLKIENEMDIKRVFTVPMSLHRILDRACVCFKPEDIPNFTLDWVNPDNPKHNMEWRKHVEGEADNLGAKAFKQVGGYIGWQKPAGERAVATPARAAKTGRIGRFQVMALLQAARYYLVKGDLEKAKSFGLNRAIFYAWAKYHGRERREAVGIRKPEGEKPLEGQKVEMLGNEAAFISGRGWFTIGGQEQTPRDYDRQIVARINSVAPYEKAWDAAVRYLSGFPKEVLLDQRRFYEKAYKPVRDRFLELLE